MKNNGKLFGKINIIDFLIIVLVVVFVAAMGLRFVLSGSKSISATNKFEFVIEVNNIRDFTVDALNKKGKVYTAKENTEIGEVTNVSVTQFKDDCVLVDGTRKSIENPMKYTAYVTVTAEGTQKDGGFYDKSKKEIGAGREFELATPHVSTTGKIISIKAVN